MKTNLKTCALTGRVLEAGDYFVETPHGAYGVKSTVDFSTEAQRYEAERKHFGEAVATALRNARLQAEPVEDDDETSVG